MKSLEIRGGVLAHSGAVLLDPFDLRLQAKNIYILRGENGTGKSTLLRALTGLHPFHSGRMESSFIKHGLVPQASHLDAQFPLTVAGFLRMYGSIDTALVQRLRLAHCMETLLRNCSGGELQKALLIRSLMSGCDFLGVDEPSALDAASRKALWQILSEFTASGGCAVVCTHEAEIPRGQSSILEIKNGSVTTNPKGKHSSKPARPARRKRVHA